MVEIVDKLFPHGLSECIGKQTKWVFVGNFRPLSMAFFLIFDNFKSIKANWCSKEKKKKSFAINLSMTNVNFSVLNLGVDFYRNRRVGYTGIHAKS